MFAGRREKKVFVEGARDLSPYLLAENKRGLAFPAAKRHRQLLSLLNELQSRAEQENYSRRGSEGAERNRTQIMRKAS